MSWPCCREARPSTPVVPARRGAEDRPAPSSISVAFSVRKAPGATLALLKPRLSSRFHQSRPRKAAAEDQSAYSLPGAASSAGRSCSFSARDRAPSWLLLSPKTPARLLSPATSICRVPRWVPGMSLSSIQGVRRQNWRVVSLSPYRRSAIREGVPVIYSVLISNRGNTDVFGVPITISAPLGFKFQLLFPVPVPPPNSSQVITDWSDSPLDVNRSEGHTW